MALARRQIHHGTEETRNRVSLLHARSGWVSDRSRARYNDGHATRDLQIEQSVGYMAEALDVVIVGAGQAGLSLSYELSHARVDHVILERGRVAETWRGRWESFCLVIPNWTLKLPGNPYRG